MLASYTPGTNRSENAVYEIPAANGVQTIVVNQTGATQRAVLLSAAGRIHARSRHGEDHRLG